MTPDESTIPHIYLADAEATRALGTALAGACAPGSVLLLRGPLGAGKTTLVDGFARALGAGRATSPSFVLAHHYAGGRLPLVHLDLFRVDDPAAIEDLDLAFYIRPDGITLVEWPERAAAHWPNDRIEVDLEIKGTGRRGTVRGFGSAAPIAESVARDFE